MRVADARFRQVGRLRAALTPRRVPEVPVHEAEEHQAEDQQDAEDDQRDDERLALLANSDVGAKKRVHERPSGARSATLRSISG